jgi:DNA-binding transcriptional LysR family regulator
LGLTQVATAALQIESAAMEPQLSLRRLEIFCLVVELGGVTRAAERLLIAQPAVSSQIKSLEIWFGAELFRRGSGRLSPTEAGDRAYRWAKETLAQSTSVHRDVQELAAGGGGRAVIGGSMAVGTYLLPDVLATVAAERPGADITLNAAQPESAIRAVELGEADFAVVTSHDDRLPSTVKATFLSERDISLMASRDGKPESQEISIGELYRLPLVHVPPNVAIHRSIEAHLRSQGLADLEPVIRLGHAESMKRTVMDRGWVAFMPDYCATAELATGALRRVGVRGLHLTERISLVQRRDHYLSPLQQVVRDAVVRAVSDHFEGAPPA